MRAMRKKNIYASAAYRKKQNRKSQMVQMRDCKNEATEIDCLRCIETEMDAMYINSAKNTQCESSISPSYSGPAQIASFSRWEFSQNKKHDTFKSRLLFRKQQISRVNVGVRNFQYTLETRNNLHDCTLKDKKLSAWNVF